MTFCLTSKCNVFDIFIFAALTLNFRPRSKDYDSTFNMLCILGRQRNGLNAQSLPPKIYEFRYLIVSSDIDVICVSEYWFSAWHSDNLFCVDGYKLFRLDRLGHGGGVTVFVKSGLPCRIKCTSEPYS